MRVIYDISVLGKGFYYPRARTGIFRVVENLAQELIKDQAISLFSSSQSVSNYFECFDYLQSDTEFSAVQLIKPDINESVFNLFQHLHICRDPDYRASIYIKGMNRLKNKLDLTLLSHKTISHNELNKADLYHSPFYPFPEPVKENNKLKKVITIYDLIPVLYPEFFQYQEDNLIYNVLKGIDKDTWVTCISEATKTDLCNYLPALDPSRVFVTALAASNLFYHCQDPLVIENVKSQFAIPEGEYILSLSTLEPRKNICQTIRCFTRIVKEEGIQGLSLVLVGTKGWDFDDIFNEISVNAKVRDRIIVTGYVPDVDLAALYSGAMMFVYPSFYEGFGLPPLEAMQCGVPVITSNTSSLPEVVGCAGIMVDPKNTDELCQSMLSIYKSSELRNKMSVDSLQQAKKFSWKKCAEQTIGVYKSAIG